MKLSAANGRFAKFGDLTTKARSEAKAQPSVDSLKHNPLLLESNREPKWDKYQVLDDGRRSFIFIEQED